MQIRVYMISIVSKPGVTGSNETMATQNKMKRFCKQAKTAE